MSIGVGPQLAPAQAAGYCAAFPHSVN